MISKLKTRRGYTLAEMLTVIAIIAIISAISAGGIISQVKSVRQMKLDNTARTIYTAAQNRLTELYSSGDTARFSDAEKRNSKPGDWTDTGETGGSGSEWKDNETLTVIRSDQNRISASDGSGFIIAGADDNRELKRFILPENSVSEEIYNNNWVIEFNPENGYVYGVFYSEDDAHTPDKFYDEPDGESSVSKSVTDTIRESREKRISETDARVGYYFGNFNIGGGSGTEDITNYITWDSGSLSSGENGEMLKLNFTAELPQKFQNSKINYYISVTGKTSKSVYKYELKGLGGGTRKRTKSLIIDKLITNDTVGTKNDLSFYTNFCSGKAPNIDAQTSKDSGQTLKFVSRSGNFLPGEDLEISFSVKGTNLSDGINAPIPDVKTVNSLFASGTDTKNNDNAAANISCGRHLQNLDAKTSHIGEDIADTKSGVRRLKFTSAVQTGNIDFNADGDYSWNTLYSGRAFSPIEAHSAETAVMSYDGGGYTIDGLDIGVYPGESERKASVNAGLFGTFYGKELKNITLTGLKANRVSAASGETVNINAGALAAITGAAGSGEQLTIDNCKVYLNSSDIDGKDESDAFICADLSAGGLIGASNNPVIIKNSFAATVINAGSRAAKATDSSGSGAGGLIGWAKNRFTITDSYADCYLKGRYIGGLVGYNVGGSETGSSIAGSYSAGFAILDGNTQMSAGIAGSDTSSTALSSLYGVYTVFDTGSGYSTASAKQYSTVPGGGVNADEVYYYSNSQSRTDTVGTKISAADLKKSGNDSAASKMNEASERHGGERVFEFDTKPSDSKPYNLKTGLALKIYEFPHLKKNSGASDTAEDTSKNAGISVHYGDWADKDFKSGTLVYFENYSDGKWGFYGNGADTLYGESTLASDNGLYIVSDGYALVYAKDDYSDGTNAEITFNGAVYNKAALLKVDVPSDGEGGLAVKTEDGWKDDAVLLLLPDAIVNAGINEDGSIDDAYSPRHYYQHITVNNNGTNEYYLFNPHFAKTVNKAENAAAELYPAANERIYIRTPRQLYMLSRFYGLYKNETRNCVYYQEADLDYESYGWTSAKPGYSRLAKIETEMQQRPIADGSSDKEIFNSTYNGRGHLITGFSIRTTAGENYAGLFGMIDGGKLMNVVFAAQYDSSNKLTVSISEPIRENGEEGYIGLLAGCVSAESSIANCAAAGFDISGYSYGNSKLYVGGLAGYNAGSISSSSSDIPHIKVQTNGSSNAYVGGFAGYNSNRGSIRNCYGLSFIDAGASEAVGEYKLGGFSGINYGRISGSYCVAAYVSSNIDSSDISAFTQGSMGSVEKCLYLNGGNYYFVDSERLYNYDDIQQNAKPATNSQLAGIVDETDTTYTLAHDLSTAFGAADSSYFHEITSADDSAQYPYPAVVTKTDGSKVHYGEWTYDASLTATGFIYWENESSGSNKGYHFYIIDSEGNEHSTLCTAHDDGGIIKEYGYGYYYRNVNATASKTVSADWENVNIGASGFKDADDGSNDKTVSLAKAEYERQFNHAYTFVLYRTSEDGVKPDTLTGEKETKDRGMYLTGNEAYASCTLSVSGGDRVKYLFTPFFAKSMIKLSEVTSDAENDAKDKLGHNTGYDASGKPSKENGFPFEIRSTSQLQNINWRFDRWNAYGEVTESDTGTKSVNNYTYLKWYAYESPEYGKDINERDGYNYYWKQSHDTNGNGQSFMPIGGLFDTVKRVNWGNPISKSHVAFFNGDYNGSSYKIQNINIDSTSQTVGLFGAAVCANLRNIILYSDSDSMIQTNSAGVNWYCLGGIVGFAAQGNIENCATAGYIIKDNRIYSGASGANIGGLAGFCATNITSSSSVNKIVIARGYDNSSEFGRKYSSEYGDSYSVNLFVGGMAGVCPGIISNSYCGGSVESLSTDSRLRIYIGGFIGGEWFRNNGLQGITKYRDLEHNITGDGLKFPRPVIRNCYSYVKLPQAGKNRVQIVVPLAGIGDLDSSKSSPGQPIYVINSYYYGPNAGNAKNTRRTLVRSVLGWYYYNFKYLYSDENAILDGDLNSKNQYDSRLNPDTSAREISNDDLEKVMSLNYDDMCSLGENGEISGKLKDMLNKNNGTFGTVDITENGGAPINGKYSFPGSDAFLNGENYPFPAVITQENPFYDENSDDPTGKAKNVYVHYGSWPGNGLFTDKSSSSIDLMTSETGTDTVNVRLTLDGNIVSMRNAPSISYLGGKSESDVVDCTWTQKLEGNAVYYTLNIKALSEGYETISLSYTDGNKTYKNKIDVVTAAELAIEIKEKNPAASTLYAGGDPVDYIITARDGNNNVILTTLGSETSPGNWRAETDAASSDIIDAELLEIEESGERQIILRVRAKNTGSAAVYISTENIYPLYDKQKTGKAVANRFNMLEVEALEKPDSTDRLNSARLYSDGTRLDSEADHPVSVPYGIGAGSYKTASDSLSYWTDKAKNDSTVNLGRTFAGWIMENGEAYDQNTELYSSVNVNASWKCQNVAFLDKSADESSGYREIGRLSYYDGVFYTDSTLSDTADRAPEACAGNAENSSFSGYWTAQDGGIRVTNSEGGFIDGACDDMPSKLYARYEVSPDEIAALASEQSAGRIKEYDSAAKPIVLRAEESGDQDLTAVNGGSSAEDSEAFSAEEEKQSESSERVSAEKSSGEKDAAEAEKNESGGLSVSKSTRSIIDPNVITDKDISYSKDDD